MRSSLAALLFFVASAAAGQPTWLVAPFYERYGGVVGVADGTVTVEVVCGGVTREDQWRATEWPGIISLPERNLYFPGETCTSLRASGLESGAWYYTNSPPAGGPLIEASLLRGPAAASFSDIETRRQARGTYFTHGGLAVIVPHVSPATEESLVSGSWSGTVRVTSPLVATGRAAVTLYEEGSVVGTAFTYDWPAGIVGIAGRFLDGRMSGNSLTISIQDLSNFPSCRYSVRAQVNGDTISGTWSSACAGTSGDLRLTRD